MLSLYCQSGSRRDTHDIVALFMEGKVKESCELQLKALPLVHALFSRSKSDPGKSSPEPDGQRTGPLRLPLTEKWKQHTRTVLASEEDEKIPVSNCPKCTKETDIREETGENANGKSNYAWL